MVDTRRARRDAERVALETLSGTMVGKAGQLGVAVADQMACADTVAAAANRARQIIEAAHQEADAVVQAAEAEQLEADGVYATAWTDARQAGWSPAQLRGMGYARPRSVKPTVRVGDAEPHRTASAENESTPQASSGWEHREARDA